MPISNTVPTYRQLDPKGFWSPDDQLIGEGEAFEFDGVPNAQMEALNEPARDQLLAYYKKLEDGAREVAMANGRAYVPDQNKLDVLIAAATADARRVELRPGDGGIPVMGSRKETSVRKVTLDNDMPITRTVGRPRKSAIG